MQQILPSRFLQTNHCRGKEGIRKFRFNLNALKRDYLKSLIVPSYKELTVAIIWDMIKISDEFIIYFQNFKSEEISECDYLISVISIINPETAKTIIAEVREKRSISQTEGN